MQAYSYNGENREYIGKTNCQIGPVRSEREGRAIYLLAANATWEALPPFDSETQRAVWVENVWTVVDVPVLAEDHPEESDV